MLISWHFYLPMMALCSGFHIAGIMTQVTPSAKDPNVTKNQRKSDRVNETGETRPAAIFFVSVFDIRKGNLSAEFFWNQFENYETAILSGN
jgi:hypothetical protein